MAEWVEGTVVEKIQWTDNLFSLRIDADVDDFVAGQFTSLALEIDGERVARPYSYLSSPGHKPLEFFFYIATDGELSNALVALEAGDAVAVKKGANGFFTLDEVPPARDIWMIGTGTGIAPYFSILNTVRPWQEYKNIILVHGVRKHSDLLYQDMIAGLQAAHPDSFHYQAFVSREAVEGAIHGRIPPALADGSLEQKVGLELSPEHSQVMLCGNPDMVRDASEALKAKGLQKNLRRKPGHITTENYW